MTSLLRSRRLHRAALRHRPPLWVDLPLTPLAKSSAAPRAPESAQPPPPAPVAGALVRPPAPAPDLPEARPLPLDHESARLYALVLEARHLPCRTPRQGPGWTVQVRRMDREQALEELHLWLTENQGQSKPHQPPPPPLPGPSEIFPPALGGLTLAAAHAFAVRAHPDLGVYPQLLLERGSANARAMLHGEWWRSITALTLHADGPHVLGNAVVGTLFIALVCRRLGCGPALLLTMLGGIFGNLCNALTMGPPHDSIGFSTAVFAAAGLLAAQGTLEGHGGWLRSLVPLGAGFGLLAMLGSGGENTDLGAHLFGFVNGLLLGLLAGTLTRRKGRPGPYLRTAAALLAVLLPVLAWIAAWLTA